MTALEDRLDLLNVQIGEVELDTALADFKIQQDKLKVKLGELTNKVELLKQNCEEYLDYASDDEERELIATAKNSLESLKKSTSTQQIDTLEKQVKQLAKIDKEVAIAMNKEELKKQGFEMMAQIEKRMSEVEQTIEDGWKALKKRTSQFNSFDLTYKAKKRLAVITEFETLSKQIRGQIAQALQTTLTRLDDSISEKDRELLS